MLIGKILQEIRNTQKEFFGYKEGNLENPLSINIIDELNQKMETFNSMHVTDIDRLNESPNRLKNKPCMTTITNSPLPNEFKMPTFTRYDRKWCLKIHLW